MMAGGAGFNTRSWLVSILKLVLPLVALGLLSTLFLFSQKINPEDAIPYATVDVADRLRDPKMTDAGYVGMTADGSEIKVDALEARPGVDGGEMTTVFGTLTSPSGSATDLTSATATLKSALQVLKLAGGAELRSAGGYTVNTPGFDVATDRTHVESTGAVDVNGPIGHLEADKMVLSQSEVGGPYLLVFNGKVRLIYQPQN